jgi:hypothetical protein
MQDSAHKFEINGLDLGSMGIGDVSRETRPDHLVDMERYMTEGLRQFLGSITFGPLVIFEPDTSDDLDVLVIPDTWCPRGDGERPFSD